MLHRDRSAWGASHRDLGDRSAWGVPHRDPPGSRVLLTETRSECLRCWILEIGVLEVLLIGVLLPSGPDNLAIVQ